MDIKKMKEYRKEYNIKLISKDNRKLPAIEWN